MKSGKPGTISTLFSYYRNSFKPALDSEIRKRLSRQKKNCLIFSAPLLIYTIMVIFAYSVTDPAAYTEVLLLASFCGVPVGFILSAYKRS
jgi:hypothetical protein